MADQLPAVLRPRTCWSLSCASAWIRHGPRFTELRMEIAAGAIALEQAEAAARAAEERAERAGGGADAERRGQGRWARLRAAWRGE